MSSTREIKEANKERLFDFDEHGENSATIYLDQFSVGTTDSENLSLKMATE